MCQHHWKNQSEIILRLEYKQIFLEEAQKNRTTMDFQIIDYKYFAPKKMIMY